MNFNKDFKEFVELLNLNNVQYLLIGGWSVAIYGQPRYTKDIDFFLYASKENSKNILNALNSFGFGDVGLSIKDFEIKGQIIQLGFEPNRIDLITEIKGVDFDTAWKNKNIIDFEGVKINVISLKDLITNKIATGRPQDIADAEFLKKIDN